jgi:hypothetical protein
MACSTSVTTSLHRQFGQNQRATKALRRSGGGATNARRGSAAVPMAFLIPNLIPNPSYRWGE